MSFLCYTAYIYGMLKLNEEHVVMSRSGLISVLAEAVAHFASDYYQMYDMMSSLPCMGNQLAL